MENEMHSHLTLIFIFSQLLLLTDFSHAVDPSHKHKLGVLAQERCAESRGLLRGGGPFKPAVQLPLTF